LPEESVRERSNTRRYGDFGAENAQLSGGFEQASGDRVISALFAKEI
jgi:hypothetical protein